MKPVVFALLIAAIIPATTTQAQDTERMRDATRAQQRTTDRERIYGSQLMTEQERNEYRARMRAARTEQERERIRREHHEYMQSRARERGMMLPDEPPRRGRMGSGNGEKKAPRPGADGGRRR